MKQIALLVFVGFLGLCQSESLCHMNKVQRCLDIEIDYIHSLPRRTLPETEEDVEGFCKSTEDVSKCLTEHRKSCTSPIFREGMDLIFEGAASLKNDFCTKGSSSRSKYLTHAGCLNTVVQSDLTNKYMQYFLASLEKLVSAPLSQKMNIFCCGYNKAHFSIRKESLEKCGEEATAVGEEFITLVLSELPSVICNGVDSDSDECKAVLPPEGSKPSEAIKENALYKFVYNVFKNHLE